jgi:hypothetical protein
MNRAGWIFVIDDKAGKQRSQHFLSGMLGALLAHYKRELNARLWRI